MNRTLFYFHRLAFPSESGQTIQVLRDYGALAELGEAVHLCYRGARRLSAAEVDAVLGDYGLSPNRALQFHFIPEGGSGKRRMRGVIEAVRDPAAPMVLVCRTMDHALSALKVRAGRKATTRVVLELHETAIPHLVYREEGRRLRAALSRAVERRVFARVDGLVATVASQLELLDRLHPDHAPAVILPNAVPASFLDAPRPAPTPGRDGRVHLRYAGQLSVWKNAGIMVESLRHLPTHIVLDIAGGKAHGQDAGGASLRAYAARLGVAERVNYVGFLPPVAVPRFLADADVLLLPLGENVQSRFFTSPMKLFEYAASGVPMVVTRQPTTLSLIEAGRHALMVEPGSAGALARAVERLVGTPELGKTLARNARAWVGEHTQIRRATCYRAFLDKLTLP